jgi:hypothetical protein
MQTLMSDRRTASRSRRAVLGMCALGTVSAAILASLSGCVILEEAKFSRTIDVAVPHVLGSAIDVESANGHITVVAGQAADVVVTAKLRAVTQERADAATVTTDRDPSGKLLVRVVWPEKRRNNEACSFEITVPDASGVKLDTSNGRIEIEGLAGQAQLETSNGEISVTNHAGPVNADTSNGAIVLKNVGAPVKADTSNGAIRVEFAPTAVGWFKLDSSNGDIDVLLSPPLRRRSRSRHQQRQAHAEQPQPNEHQEIIQEPRGTDLWPACRRRDQVVGGYEQWVDHRAGGEVACESQWGREGSG